MRFANRSCSVLVGTDVAARGLDIADLPVVIMYDIASDADTHVHRSGRTGRAGRSGLALTLCSSREMGRARVIEERLGAPLRWEQAKSAPARLRTGQLAFFVAIDEIAREVEEDVSRFELDRSNFLDMLRRVEDDVVEEQRAAGG